MEMEQQPVVNQPSSPVIPFSDPEKGSKESKGSFWTGLFLGVAIMSIIGLGVVLTMQFQGCLDNKKAAQNQQVNTGNNNQQQPTDNQPAKEVKLKEITKQDHWRGNFDSKVTVVTFTDLQCPYCQKFHVNLEKAFTDYKDKVRFVYKSFPLESIHPYAKKAAEAAECANDQAKYFQYIDKVFANQAKFSDSLWSQLAKEVGLNEKDFNQCLSSGKYTSKVEEQSKDALSSGVEGTPATFVNGKSVYGAVPYEELKSMIDAALK